MEEEFSKRYKGQRATEVFPVSTKIKKNYALGINKTIKTNGGYQFFFEVCEFSLPGCVIYKLIHYHWLPNLTSTEVR